MTNEFIGVLGMTRMSKEDVDLAKLGHAIAYEVAARAVFAALEDLEVGQHSPATVGGMGYVASKLKSAARVARELSGAPMAAKPRRGPL